MFEQPEPPRPSVMLSELRTLEPRMFGKSCDNLRPPEYLWPYLFVEEEHDLAPLLANKQRLLQAVQTAIEVLEGSPELEFSRRGGRHRDPRLDRFVLRLARIFRYYAKRDETFTVSWETGKLSSPFISFVDEAIRQFHPEHHVSPGTLRGAIQDIRRYRRDTEDLTPEELDQLLGPSGF